MFRLWHRDRSLLEYVRRSFVYDDNGRGTQYVYDGLTGWAEPLREVGPALLARASETCAAEFSVVAVQGYRDGTAGTGWHSDTPFAAQAILSLGASRRFGTRDPAGEPSFVWVNDGDLVFMAAGHDRAEHCVPPDRANIGERCSLVFRIPKD